MDWVTIGLIALAFIVVVSIIVREYVKKDELDIVQKIDQTTKEAKALFDWGDDPNWDKTQDMNLEAAAKSYEAAAQTSDAAAREATLDSLEILKRHACSESIIELLGRPMDSSLPKRKHALLLDVRSDTFYVPDEEYVQRLSNNGSQLQLIYRGRFLLKDKEGSVITEIAIVPVTQHQRDSIINKNQGKTFLKQERERIGNRIKTAIRAFYKDTGIALSALDFVDREDDLIEEILTGEVNHITRIKSIDYNEDLGEVAISLELNYLWTDVLVATRIK